VPTGKALTRSGAQLGDDIWVSGYLGHAALGLAHLQEKIKLDARTRDTAIAALHQPQPRVAVGLALRDIANSCIDISDGLLADLNHILQASRTNVADNVAMGAFLQLESIPCIASLNNRLQEPIIQQALLTGGDDYELCFTASVSQRETITAIAKQLDINLTRIGEMNNSGNLTVQFEQQEINITILGYDHFAQTT
jgi:thiamine-monophosphate kinase